MKLVPVHPRSRRRLAHLLLTGVAMVWGSTFPLVKAALHEVSPLLFNFLRMLLAAALLSMLNGRSLRQLSRRQILMCALPGVFLALGYGLQTTGLAYTTPSKSAFLTGLIVVLVPFLSLVPGLRSGNTPVPPWTAYLGAATAFVGIVLLTSEPGVGSKVFSGMHRGEWLSLASAVAFATHLLVLARLARRLPAKALGTLQIAFAAAVMLPLTGMEHTLRLHWTPVVVVALLVTAVLATAVAFTVQSWAQQVLPATHTALILTLEPVFALLTALLFLHERLRERALAGAGLILVGIVVAELGPTALTEAGILPLEPKVRSRRLLA